VSEHCFEVPQQDAGSRLDVFLSRTNLGLSRNQIQRLIEQNHIRVNDEPQKASYRLRPEEQIAVFLPPLPPTGLVPESIPLDILFEDESLIVVNKPAGLVVHPAAGHRQGTLVHALLHHCDNLAELGGPFRPGIVHRLDKDTSGILAVAKNNLAYTSLSRQFKEHRVRKEYSALVCGRLRQATGQITAPIHRHPRHRKKMGIGERGREAFTSWSLEVAFSEASLVEVVIKTGRTHQIRVHFAHVNNPLVGDATYGGKNRARSIRDPLVRSRLLKVKRQMLHARRLVLEHPDTGEKLKLTAPLPGDMDSLISFLKEYG
jgi:23S rRNA pseudouridine1911/1915/1917 synthase